jgi:hypothetical protein
MEQDDARGEDEADSPAAHSDGVDWDAMATVGTAYPAGRAAEFGTLNGRRRPGFGRFSARVYRRLSTGSENSLWRL